MPYSEKFTGIIRHDFCTDENAEINPTDDILKDYGAESLDVREFVIDLMIRYKIVIEDEELERLYDDVLDERRLFVSSVAKYIEEKTGIPV